MDRKILKQFFEKYPTDNIPPELFCDFDKKPFEKCLMCEVPLHFCDFYLIQKVFNKQSESTMEMAVCFDCASKHQTGYSQESMAHMQNFLISRYNYKTELNCCTTCDNGVLGKDEFMIGIWCNMGSYLKQPGSMCGTCMRELSEGLSQETKDNDRRFKEKLFPGIPRDFGLIPSMA